jgi:hypothetical protein
MLVQRQVVREGGSTEAVGHVPHGGLVCASRTVGIRRPEKEVESTAEAVFGDRDRSAEDSGRAYTEGLK